MKKEAILLVLFLIIIPIIISAISNSPIPKLSPTYEPCFPKLTYNNSNYSQNEFNTFDFWLANSDTPTPLVIYIHGGGFSTGDKEEIYHNELCFKEQETSLIKIFLDNKISVASVNYRLINSQNPQWAYTQEYYQKNPTPAPIFDIAKAISFFRANSEEYNIDKNKIALTGTSAGGAASFWLGFHDNILHPEISESTKPNCIAPLHAQSTLDPTILNGNYNLPELSNNPTILGFYNLKPGQVYSNEYLQLFNQASPLTYSSPDDPPVFMYYNKPIDSKDKLHNPLFGLYAETFLKQNKIPYELHYPNHNELNSEWQLQE